MQVALEEHELLECVEREANEIENVIEQASDTVEVKRDKQRNRERRAKKDRKCKSLLISRIHDTQLSNSKNQ